MRLTYLMNDSGAKVLIVDAVLDTVGQMDLTSTPHPIRVGASDGDVPEGVEYYDDVMAASPDAPAPVAGSEGDTAMIM